MRTQYAEKTERRQKEWTPIVPSVLDNDFYQLTMGQFAFRRYAGVPVKYALTCRTKGARLGEAIDEKDLRRELDHVRGLGASEAEIAYLRTLKNNGQQLFGEDYLNFLRSPQLPDYKLTRQGENYALEIEGPWESGIYWETPALAVISELYYRATTKGMDAREIHAEGERRLEEKVKTFQENPGVRFIEFGTRRRFSRDWQEYVVRKFKEEIPTQMIGTSNVYLAMKHGLKAIGTHAHQAFMVMSGIMHKDDDEIRASHGQFLREWWEDYGYDLSIALTDTYGSDFFFRDFTDEQARKWKGLRQDSGDEIAFADKQIAFYEEREIDPKEKLFVPSDGLETPKIVFLHNAFNHRINTIAGCGTHMTNDLGRRPVSMVIKAVEANGHGTVKLSDNPAKATGKPEDVARFMKIFEYDPTKYQRQECRY